MQAALSTQSFYRNIATNIRLHLICMYRCSATYQLMSHALLFISDTASLNLFSLCVDSLSQIVNWLVSLDYIFFSPAKLSLVQAAATIFTTIL